MQPLKLPVPTPVGEALPVAIERVARELRRIECDFVELEVHISDAIAAAASAKVLNIKDLQKMDQVRQEIGGIAEFVSAISQAVPDCVLIEAQRLASVVSLSDLGRRLGGGVGNDLDAVGTSDGFYLLNEHAEPSE